MSSGRQVFDGTEVNACSSSHRGKTQGTHNETLTAPSPLEVCSTSAPEKPRSYSIYLLHALKANNN